MKRTTSTRIRSLKWELKRKIATALGRTAEGGGHVNVAGRINAKVVANIGQPGSVQAASTRQYAPIRQSTRGSSDDGEVPS